MTLPISKKPTSMNPSGKKPSSPRIPIPAGIASPPKRKITGTVRETATFLTWGGPILDRAAKPAGKKHPARTGCRNKTGTIHTPRTIPKSTVLIPVARNTPPKARLGPSWSVAHPARKTTPSPTIRESSTRLLAQPPSSPCSATKYRGSRLYTPV